MLWGWAGGQPQIKVTVQVFDYEDGTPDEVPAPEKMILTAAAGARVETTELIRESDTPPVTQVKEGEALSHTHSHTDS